MTSEAPSGQRIHSVTVTPAGHHVDTWRTPLGNVVLFLMDADDELADSMVMPFLLARVSIAQRFYRARLTRRWAMAQDPGSE
jgi:hypothetical protein